MEVKIQITCLLSLELFSLDSPPPFWSLSFPPPPSKTCSSLLYNYLSFPKGCNVQYSTDYITLCSPQILWKYPIIAYLGELFNQLHVSSSLTSFAYQGWSGQPLQLVELRMGRGRFLCFGGGRKCSSGPSDNTENRTSRSSLRVKPLQKQGILGNSGEKFLFLK